MKKALISPNETPISYISAWTEKEPYQPIYSDYPNSCRIAEISDIEFEVASPLFWVDCADDVTPNQFYFDTKSQTIKPIVNAPMPEVTQPTATGMQTL